MLDNGHHNSREFEKYRGFTIVKGSTNGYYAEESPALYCISVEVLKRIIDSYWERHQKEEQKQFKK